MSAKQSQRSADIPVRDSESKGGLENPRSFPGQSADLSVLALSKAETYRPISEIVAKCNAFETEAKETDKALREILEKTGAVR